MNNLIKNEKGYTLLEIVLSLSILSVVTLVFFGFFVQAKSYSFQSRTSMSAGQLSQEILAKVKSSNLTSNVTLTDWRTLYNIPADGNMDSQGFFIQVNNIKFYPVVKMSQASSPFSTNLALIQVQIFVYQKGTMVEKFETYGFKGWNQS